MKIKKNHKAQNQFTQTCVCDELHQQLAGNNATNFPLPN